MIGQLREPIIFYSKASVSRRKLSRIHSYLEDALVQTYRSFYPSTIAEYKDLLQKQQAKGGTAIICGGDGFLHHGLEYLVNSDIDLLPIPGGTANDFSREMGWHHLFRKNGTTERRKIDCLSLDGKYFLTIAGSGIGSGVISSLDKLRSNKKYERFATFYGKWIYLVLSLYRIIKERNELFQYEVSLDGKVLIQDRASSVFICNQGKLGGLFHICRTSDNTDGIYEFVAKSERSFLHQFVSGIKQLFGKGKPGKDIRLNFQDGVTISFEHERNHGFYADGELLSSNGRLFHEIAIHPACISVIHRK